MKEKEIIQSLMVDGLTKKEIAKKLKCGKTKLYGKLKTYGLTIPHKPITIEEIEIMKNMYSSGKTCKEISKHLKRHRTIISDKLKGLGVKIEQQRGKGPNREKTIKNKTEELRIKNPNLTDSDIYHMITSEIGPEFCSICGCSMRNIKKHRTRCGPCDTKLRRYRLKKKAVEYKGGKCQDCGILGTSINIAIFDFHHLVEKDFNLSMMATIKWEVVKTELDKCIMLCSNCHRMRHNDYGNEKLLLVAEQCDTNKYES
ncbi:MAG: HNH endonuclease [bacterium]|nr:HNH endonuclease [bacterium]